MAGGCMIASMSGPASGGRNLGLWGREAVGTGFLAAFGALVLAGLAKSAALAAVWAPSKGHDIVILVAAAGAGFGLRGRGLLVCGLGLWAGWTVLEFTVFGQTGLGEVFEVAFLVGVGIGLGSIAGSLGERLSGGNRN